MYKNLTEPTRENYEHARTPVLNHMDPSTKHAHMDYHPNLTTRLFSVFNPINPFAKRFTPTNEGHSFFAPRNENKNHSIDPYTWRDVLTENNYRHNHLDPTEEANPEYQKKTELYKMHSGVGAVYNIKKPELPYVCRVRKKDVRRCRIANDDNDLRCEPEINRLLEECPNFALRIMNKMKVFNERVKNIQRKEYFEAMAISDYNLGTSIINVDSNIRYVDGTAQNLRPDTMWADDRYADVTQEQIDAATQRVETKYGKVDFDDLKDKPRVPGDRAYYGSRTSGGH